MTSAARRDDAHPALTGTLFPDSEPGQDRPDVYLKERQHDDR